MSKKSEAIVALETDNRKIEEYAGEVFIPGIFQGEKLYRFKMIEIRFLRALGETQDISLAAAKCEIPIEKATAILNKKEIRRFLESRLQEISVHRGWTVERWFSEGHQVWMGKKKISREQAEIWKEFGSRIAPKTERIQVESSDEEFVFTVRSK